jgi:hypothetical protein
MSPGDEDGPADRGAEADPHVDRHARDGAGPLAQLVRRERGHERRLARLQAAVADPGGHRPDVRQEQRRLDVGGEVTQARVAPRRIDAAVATRRAAVAGGIPADPGPVTVGGLDAEARMEALDR